MNFAKSAQSLYTYRCTWKGYINQANSYYKWALANSRMPTFALKSSEFMK